MTDVDVPCDVCRHTESEENNEMIFCDKCNVCVHQACYGVSEIPKGSWFCKPCEMDLQPHCLFCHKDKGAMKNAGEGKWGHVSCTMWIPEVSFRNPDTMEPITNIDKIPKSRWALTCALCHKKGACIQCYLPRCKKAHHVTCALENGLHMDMIDVENSENEVKFESFCKKHTERSVVKSKSKRSLPKKRKRSLENDDKTVAQLKVQSHTIGESSGQNHASTSPNSIIIKDVRGSVKFPVENENGIRNVERKNKLSHEDSPRTNIFPNIIKRNARKSFPVQPRALHEAPPQRLKKLHLRDYVLKNGQKKLSAANKPQAQTKVPNEHASKRKSNRPVRTKREFLVQKDLKRPSEESISSKQPQSGKASVIRPSSIRTLFPSPQHSQQEEYKLLSTGNQSSPRSLDHPLPEPGLQSPAVGSGDQMPLIQGDHPPSTKINDHTCPGGDNLKFFLDYLGSLLKLLPANESLKMQYKLVDVVMKKHCLSSTEEFSDLSSESD